MSRTEQPSAHDVAMSASGHRIADVPNLTEDDRWPIRRWLPLRREVVRADVLAGLTVGLLLVPQSMAYARLAGLAPEHGLWAAVLPPIVGALCGWCHQMSTGPVAMTALLTASVLAPFAATAPPGSAAYAGLALLLALLVAGIRIVAGLLRLSGIANLISHPVLVGFTAAAALIIAASQLHALLGVPRVADAVFFRGIAAEITSIGSADLAVLAMGVLCLAGFLGLRRLASTWPGSLLVCALAILISWLAGFGAGHPARIVGAIPQGLPPLTWPQFDAKTVLDLLPAAGWVALIGFLEVLAVAKACAARTGQSVDLDRELLGQGAAGVAAAATGGFPVSGSLSRSALNLAAGARSGLSSLVAAGVVLAALLVLTPVLHHLPQATLAALVIASIVSLVDLPALVRAWRTQRHDGIAGAITFAATLYFAPDVTTGMEIGALLAVVLFVWRTTRPRVALLALHGDGTWRDADRHSLALMPDLAVLRFDGRLYFANAAALEDAVLTTRRRLPSLRYVLIAGDGINEVDATGIEVLRRVQRQLAAAGIVLAAAELKGQVTDAFARAGGSDAIIPESLRFRTLDEAVAILRARHDLPEPNAPMTRFPKCAP